jgi:putative Mn2+ efflux pump MntP
VPVLSAVLVALVSNVDNLTVGLALGIHGRRVAMTPNGLMAALTMAGTAGAMTSGHALASLLRPPIASAVGGMIVLAIGFVTAAIALATLRRPATDAPAALTPMLRSRGVISLRDAVPVGIALSLNNIGTGVGAGIAHVSPLLTTLLAGFFSLASVGGGSRVGRSLGQRVGRRAPLLAGVVLATLGAAMIGGIL